MRYTLTLAVGNRFTAARKAADYRIDLLADGVSVAFAMLIGGDVSIPAGTFVDLTASFDSPASGGVVGQALTVRLTASNNVTPNAARQGNFDNARLDATVVPEPACAGLIALAVPALLTRRRHRAR